MSTSRLQPIPYLSFSGNCAEAMDFYASVLGGEIISKALYGDMPEEAGIPEAAKNLVMNAQLKLPGDMMLYGGDASPDRWPVSVNGFMVTLNFGSVEEAESVFAKLAEGGSVTMPIAPTFWAERFGMLTDRFGIHWAFNGNLF